MAEIPHWLQIYLAVWFGIGFCCWVLQGACEFVTSHFRRGELGEKAKPIAIFVGVCLAMGVILDFLKSNPWLVAIPFAFLAIPLAVFIGHALKKSAFGPLFILAWLGSNQGEHYIDLVAGFVKRHTRRWRATGSA
jgi:hypothetical protein